MLTKIDIPIPPDGMGTEGRRKSTINLLLQCCTGGHNEHVSEQVTKYKIMQFIER